MARFHVSSEVGRGSTFTLTLPAEPLPEPADEDEKPAASAHQPAAALQGRVLCVEDDPSTQMVLRHLLRKLHLEVDIAEDGQWACEMAEQSRAAGRPYDLILMDIQLPRMNGYDATRWLRDHDWPSPIVALTAHAMVGDREKCLNAGCHDYLAKPISGVSLHELLARYLQPAAVAVELPG